MKHRLSITILLLSMFLITQFIGLFVVNAYSPIKKTIIESSTGKVKTISINQNLPYGLQNQSEEPSFFSIVLSFILAFAIIFTLMKYKWKFVIKTWFFVVIILAISISINAFLKTTITAPLKKIELLALLIAFPLAYFKIIQPNVFVHNLTELLIYPGIAAVFVPLLSPLSIIALLVLISFYDMWAVWKSQVMQKMAKFQMEELRLFGGFLIPTVSKKTKEQIKKIKQKYKNKKLPKKIKNKKFKVNLAILGGGDVIFPIITAGVFMNAFGLISALFVLAGAFIGLAFLFFITKKGRAYPAMPYISVGIFLGMLSWKILLSA